MAHDNNYRKKVKSEYLKVKNNGTIFQTIPNKFDSEIHEMIPHHSGSGFVQRVKIKTTK